MGMTERDSTFLLPRKGKWWYRTGQVEQSGCAGDALAVAAPALDRREPPRRAAVLLPRHLPRCLHVLLDPSPAPRRGARARRRRSVRGCGRATPPPRRRRHLRARRGTEDEERPPSPRRRDGRQRAGDRHGRPVVAGGLASSRRSAARGRRALERLPLPRPRAAADPDRQQCARARCVSRRDWRGA